MLLKAVPEAQKEELVAGKDLGAFAIMAHLQILYISLEDLERRRRFSRIWNFHLKLQACQRQCFSCVDGSGGE